MGLFSENDLAHFLDPAGLAPVVKEVERGGRSASPPQRLPPPAQGRRAAERFWSAAIHFVASPVATPQCLCIETQSRAFPIPAPSRKTMRECDNDAEPERKPQNGMNHAHSLLREQFSVCECVGVWVKTHILINSHTHTLGLLATARLVKLNMGGRT